MPHISRAASHFVALSALLTVCSSHADAPVATAPLFDQNIALQTYDDPWPKAAPRERDIANTLYSQTLEPFDYAAAQVTLSYNRQQKNAYFSGHISARGLKPNFAYQLKLAGKPIGGNRGTARQTSYIEASSTAPGATPIVQVINDAAGSPTPINGDDWSNQQLGYAGRWWDNSAAPSTNLNDAYFRNNTSYNTVYGYIFMGDFVTDASGHAEADISAAHSYHITWQDAQSNATKDVRAGTFSVVSAPPFYGYKRPIDARKVVLWYEYEKGRAHEVKLAPGTYHCRLLVTEETFHTAGGLWGGVWKTVLATETNDDNPANDLTFVIGG